MKKLVLLLLVIGLSLAGGWWIGSHRAAPNSAGTTPERKISHYQSPMHPWIKSDKPGKCTVCGMDLVPIYEGGGSGDNNADTSVVMLAEDAPQVASVQTTAVQKERLTRTLRFAGIIDDDDSRHRIVSAYAGGRLEKLYVNFEGAEVEAGQPLALLYSPELLAAAREYTLARKQGNGAIAGVSATRLQQMGLTVEQIEQVPNRAENDLYFQILAPVSGTVVKRTAYEGQYVAQGDRLMEIGDFSTMWLQFNVYEQDLPFLRVGQTVEISLPSLPGKKISAPITFFNPNLDEMTRTARVRVNLANPTSADGLHRAHELLHKTYAEARVLAELPEVLAVPRSAVLWPGEQPRVYVEKSPGHYEPRNVTLGRPGDDAWEVLDGLVEGERVVVSGNMLIDGQAQINRLAAPEPMADAAMKMTEHDANLDYLTAVAALGEALSKDDLPAYQNALLRVPNAPEGFPRAAPQIGADLASSRLAFQTYSAAVSGQIQKMHGAIPGLKIFSCPMSNQGSQGLPKNAEWVQFSPTIRNPYLGRAMVDCGTEVPLAQR